MPIYSFLSDVVRFFKPMPDTDGIPAGNTITSSLVANPETPFAWSIVIPAGAEIGSMLEIRAAGIISTLIASVPFTLRVKINGTTIATGNYTPALNLTNRGWQMVLRCVLQDASHMEVQGNVQFGSTDMDMRNTAAIAIDTTQEMLVTITAQWGALALGGNIQLRIFTVESIRKMAIIMPAAFMLLGGAIVAGALILGGAEVVQYVLDLP